MKGGMRANGSERTEENGRKRAGGREQADFIGLSFVVPVGCAMLLTDFDSDFVLARPLTAVPADISRNVRGVCTPAHFWRIFREMSATYVDPAHLWRIFREMSAA